MTLLAAKSFLEAARHAAAADPCPRTEQAVQYWRRIVERKEQDKGREQPHTISRSA